MDHDRQPPRLRRSRDVAPAPLGLTMALALGLAATACSPGGAPTAGPPTTGATRAVTGTPTAPVTSEPSLASTAPPPAPSGALLVPSEFSIELEPGRYFSIPPFELAFTFEVAEEGWQSGHLNGEFFDLQRYDGVPADGVPSALVGFAHPDTVQGPEGNVDVAGLTPRAAVELLTGRIDLDTANVGALELVGREAVRVDVHAAIENTPVFGGQDGTFRQGVDHDSRLVFVPIEGGLLLLIVGAPAEDLETVWARALPILESIQLSD
jgi:hypothetical protein